jgi:hypothetical protein
MSGGAARLVVVGGLAQDRHTNVPRPAASCVKASHKERAGLGAATGPREISTRPYLCRGRPPVQTM